MKKEKNNKKTSSFFIFIQNENELVAQLLVNFSQLLIMLSSRTKIHNFSLMKCVINFNFFNKVNIID